ncbi:MAG: sugar ABC transporter permease [Firmicutes bacterium]|nr:sugar ABC transporter permease [Bacillota bacterium]
MNPSSDRPKHRRRLSLESEGLLGWLFVAPSLIVIGLIIAYPLFLTVYLSFLNINLLRPKAPVKFVGLDNFIWLFTKADWFWKAFGNSVVLTFGSIALLLLVGIPVALALNRNIPGKKLIRSITILPWAVPTVVAAIMWVWAFNAELGWVNKMLVSTGIFKHGIPWLGDTKTSMLAVIIAHVWKQLPFVVLVLLAGLQSIPTELREAARVDGAGAIAEFFHVTLPGLRYVIWVIVILRTIWTFNWFDYVYLMTGGGPADSTLTLPIMVYKTNFMTFRVSQASAIAAFMMLILIILIVIFTHVQQRTAFD